MNAPPAARFERLDALRGAAMLWMLAFHFCFDLNLFGLLQPRQQFLSDPFWTLQRTGIVTMFLFCVGLSQAIALHRGQSWSRFWRRWAQIVACALLVSLASAWMFKSSWISFGVLHSIAVLLVLARWAAPLGLWLWPLGLVAILLPHGVQHPFFDHRATNWVGLVTQLPYTEDWVPVLPWLGVVLWGLAAGQWLLKPGHGLLVAPLKHRVGSDGQGPRLTPAAAAVAALAALGRWPLSFYMLHQPILIGGLMLGRKLGGW